MDFIKKHYEKVILGVVLVGFFVAVAALPFKIANERQGLEEVRLKLTNPKVKPLTNLDLTVPESGLKRLSTPIVVDFSGGNKLFNPRAWVKRSDNVLIPDSRIGPKAVTVTNITPLYLKLTLDSVTTSDTGPRYVVGVEKEAASNPSARRKKQSYCQLHEKTDTFIVRDVKGPPENPTQLVLELTDTGEKVGLVKDQVYRRVDGYMADLKYEPENRTWKLQRVGNSVHFNGEDYKIVAIDRNEVVLSAPNQKKWTLKETAAPPP